MQTFSNPTRFRIAGRRGGDPRSTAGRPETRSDRLGQVATPPAVALRMAELLLKKRRRRSFSVFDPCVGLGAFPEALAGFLEPGDSLTALDIDPAMVAEARRHRLPQGITSNIQVADYLRWKARAPFDGIILNPPYLRQEWIDRKLELQDLFQRNYGAIVPGTSNMYVYFLVKAINELKAGGVLAAIVYDAWTYTKYGQWLRAYLDRHCSNLNIEHVKGQPFENRLIDATIICATKLRESQASQTFTESPREGPGQGLSRPIGELYKSRRGLRLKQASFFLCEPDAIDTLGATRFLKHVRYVNGHSVSARHPQAALVVVNGSTHHPAMPELKRRLRAAYKQPDKNRSILTWAEQRPESWFAHAEPPRAPIVFNYYMRGRQRHLFNPGIAYADNFYGLIPRHEASPFACLAALNSGFTSREIANGSRNQGGGLSKIQLYEYRDVLTPAVHLLPKEIGDQLERLGRALISSVDPISTVAEIDRLLNPLLEAYSTECGRKGGQNGGLA